jgi:hypothetical protein
MTRLDQIKLRTAIFLIKREDPIPMDLEIYLLSRGYDVSRLYDIYRP